MKENYDMIPKSHY